MVHLRFIPFYVALACLAAAPQNACASTALEIPDTDTADTLADVQNPVTLPAPALLPRITMPSASAAPAATPAVSAAAVSPASAVLPQPAAETALSALPQPTVPILPSAVQPATPATAPLSAVNTSATPIVEPVVQPAAALPSVNGLIEPTRPAAAAPMAFQPAAQPQLPMMMTSGMPAYGAPAMPYPMPYNMPPMSYNMPPMPYGMPPMPYGGFYPAPMMPAAYPSMMSSAYSFPPMMPTASPGGQNMNSHPASVQAITSPGGTTINFYGGMMGPDTQGQIPPAGVGFQDPTPQPVHWAPLPSEAQHAAGAAESAANNIAISVAAPAGAFDTLMVKTGWFSDLVSHNYEDAVAGSFGGKPRQIGADDRDRLRKKQGELFETLYGKTDLNGAVSQVAMNLPAAEPSDQGGSLMGRFMEMFARRKTQDASSGQGCNCQLTLAGAPVNAVPIPQPAAAGGPTSTPATAQPAGIAPSMPQMRPAAIQQVAAPVQDPRLSGFTLLGYAKASDGKNYPVVQEKGSGQLYYGTSAGAPLRDPKTGQYTPFGGTADQIIKV